MAAPLYFSNSIIDTSFLLNIGNIQARAFYRRIGWLEIKNSKNIPTKCITNLHLFRHSRDSQIKVFVCVFTNEHPCLHSA